MKYQHIIQAVYFEPWLIKPAAHAAVRALLESHLAETAQNVLAQREGKGICGEKVELDQMEIIDGIAHIPIGGVIGRKLSGWEKGAGAVDVLDVRKELAQAVSDDTVKAIILDIDSPGGMVNGTPELANAISRVEKPIYAFTAGDMCSAAYWIGAAADAIYATDTADIGSIGVYIPWMDQSARYKQAGVSVELFTSGKYKGMGYPGTSLTRDQADQLQARVDEVAAAFHEHVRTNRGDVSGDAMQGQTFLGRAALDESLIDGMVEDKDELASVILSQLQ